MTSYFLKQLIDSKINITVQLEKQNKGGYTSVNRLLQNKTKASHLLKTFLEAVNATGNKELLQAVYDAKGWAADGQDRL